MNNLKQLTFFIELQSKKLQQLRLQYLQAQQYQFEQQQRLSGLENYRLEYLKEIRQKVQQGLQAKGLIQHQNFVGKLDKACEQQINVINQSVMVCAQRKTQYLEQQKKLDALNKYLQTLTQQSQLKLARQEQKDFDEIAQQQYYRQQQTRLH